MQPLLTIADFHNAIKADHIIVITDKATGTHIHTPPCPSLKLAYFEKKVVQGKGKTGAYFAFPSMASAIAAHGNHVCSRCIKNVGTSVFPAGPTHPNPSPEYRVEAKVGLVQAWSTKRLNFLPKDWRKSLRDNIRAAVSQLSAGAQERQQAEFISLERGNFDAENVLFFNLDIKGKPFAASAGTAIRFEHGFSQPPPSPGGATFAHYHRYQVQSLNSPLVPWPNSGSLGKPALWQPRSMESRRPRLEVDDRNRPHH